MTKPKGMTSWAYRRYQAYGLSDEKISELWEHEQSVKNHSDLGREVTSSTYSSAQKRLKNKIDLFCGIKEEK